MPHRPLERLVLSVLHRLLELLVVVHLFIMSFMLASS